MKLNTTDFGILKILSYKIQKKTLQLNPKWIWLDQKYVYILERVSKLLAINLKYFAYGF